MEKISKKSSTKLYDSVFEEIMNARVKISRLTTENGNKSLGINIDNILSDLTMSCPKKAIDCFKYPSL